MIVDKMTRQNDCRQNDYKENDCKLTFSRARKLNKET